jgi:hypothetical protein
MNLQKKIFLIIFIILNINAYANKFERHNSYITTYPIFYAKIGIQENVKSRLGDQLNTYIKALWFSHKYNLPYLHVHFDYENLLKAGYAHTLLLDDFISEHLIYNKIHIKKFSENIFHNNLINQNFPTIFVVTLYTTYTETDDWRLHTWKEMRNDKIFIKKIRSLLTADKNLNPILPPKNKLSIALHIRKGTGFDLPLWSIQYYDETILDEESKKNYDFTKKFRKKYQDCLRPLKSVPEQYYVDQVSLIAKKFPATPLYVHVFTDDPYPLEITQRLKEKIEHQDIEFCTRTTENRHDCDYQIIEDMLSMANFDVLIRTISGFSDVAHVLGNHKLVIYPIDTKWVGRCLVITNTNLEINHPIFNVIR